MKLLFLSGVYPAELEDEYRQLCKGHYLQNAPNVFQWGIISGLVDNKADFYVLSFPFLPCYPIRLKVPKIKPSFIIVDNKRVGEVVPYSTIVGIKHMSIELQVYRYITNWIRYNVDKNEPFVVLTYSPQSYFIKPLKKIKRTYPNMTVATIVTDLVDDMSSFASNNTFLKEIQTKFEINQVKKHYKIIDKYVLLTEAMTEKIPESKEAHIIIEGLAEIPVNTDKSIEKIKHSILYAGTLEEYSGVKILIDAFYATKNDENKLIICGTGTCQKYVEEKATLDPRIEFRGSLPRSEILKLQKQVSLLINPRQPTNEITRFSFPSKTIEYLSSGTPMIGYKLEGIPKEYYEYMYVVNENSIETLQQTIEEVLSKSSTELAQFGQRAKDFILEKKTAKVQVSKIINFLQS